MTRRGEQAGSVEQLGERAAAAVGQSAQLYVAARGQFQVPVAEAVGGERQRRGLRPGEQPAREPDPREEPVVRRVQPQRAGAGVTALPYDGFVPRCGGRGLGHGREHTHDPTPGTCVHHHPDQQLRPHPSTPAGV